MQKFTALETNLLEAKLRECFDQKCDTTGQDRNKCRTIIVISKKINLRYGFVRELENDFNFEFNNH